ncbi:hypothetical protein G6O67_000586 [Ophiocordyceps sinensis]|uniref:Uncharacterized protein n=1 Tax=Ophiocordyceps sinensis TaxID=72228 RepID=A0A8H4PZD6_9HYPO|nr:hypothetical protein G6O67_000586 [Ophiocordyceps sinensis]
MGAGNLSPAADDKKTWRAVDATNRGDNPRLLPNPETAGWRTRMVEPKQLPQVLFVVARPSLRLGSDRGSTISSMQQGGESQSQLGHCACAPSAKDCRGARCIDRVRV